ncbi:MAG: UvrB/UvrC motif-containing protein [Syntrophomonas sp.]|nr:UvrB/UvrC motif-containing protein [Syntrophomonas sp.]
MYCEECKKRSATVHLTQVFNGQKTESHLCEECASQKSGFMFDPANKFSIPNLLGGMFGSSYSVQGMPALALQSICPNCGMRYMDIRQAGKLGCSECYKVFNQELEAPLRRIHGNSQHLGKIPLRGGEKVIIRRQIEKLKNQLQEAVRAEEYEKAAEIRDSVKEMESKLL